MISDEGFDENKLTLMSKNIMVHIKSRKELHIDYLHSTLGSVDHLLYNFIQEAYKYMKCLNLHLK